MTVDTAVHDALNRIETERDRVTGELTAFDRFEDAVCEIDPVSPTDSTGTAATSGGSTVAVASLSAGPSTGTERADRVRERFAETVGRYPDPAADGSNSTVEIMAEKLGEEVAATLAPSTPGRFTPEVKAAVRTATAKRTAQLRAMDRALDAERDALERALESIDSVVQWLAEADQTPLLSLGFEALRARHETLAAHRDRCRAVLDERQAFLRGTTTYHAAAGVGHRSLVEYLYDAHPTSYPVVSTALRLESLCTECQRAVRDHLTRRV